LGIVKAGFFTGQVRTLVIAATVFFAGKISFWLPNQQHLSAEAYAYLIQLTVSTYTTDIS